MELDKETLYNLYIVKGMSQLQVANELGTTESRIDYWTRKFGLQYKKSDPDRVFNLKHIDKEDPIFCYYAGLVATDGYLDYKNKRIAVRVSNEGSDEVLEALRKYFGYSRPVNHYVAKATNHVNHELMIPNKCIFEELACMGIKGKKDQRTYSVNWFLNVHADCQRMFLRGVLDGDGNLNYKTGAFRIAMQSVDFIDALILCINKLFNFNYTKSVQKNSTGKTYPALWVHKADSFILYDFIYKSFSKYRFADKYNRFLSLK